MAKILIENGANIHAQNEAAIRYSTNKNYFEIVKLLIINGADIHVNNDQIIRLFDGNKNVEMIKYLINFDIDYFSINIFAKKFVIKYNLKEFYEIFNIRFSDKLNYFVDLFDVDL
jgi:ankyrin repeat protein